MQRVALHLVTWNGERYIPFLFESLRKQTYRNVVLRVLDNASHDATLDLIKKEMRNFFCPVELIENQVNEGFAGGQNQLFKKTKEEYVLLINQDMYLAPDCLEKLVGEMQSAESVAAVAPRLMKWEFDRIEKDGLLKSFSDRIDSLGLIFFRNRRVAEWRSGEKWSDSPETVVEVAGISGALPLYRMKALHAIADKEGNIFDPLFESYKEDVDVAWRLHDKGFRACVVTDAVAYHDRATAMPKYGQHDIAAAINKFSQRSDVRYFSYRNHLLMLFKNENSADFWPNAPWIIWYEIKKFLVLLISYPSVVIKSWQFIWCHRQELRVSRQWNKRKK